MVFLKYDFSHPAHRREMSGFALPTVLISAIVMLIVLLSAGTAASTVRTALDEQHFNKLAQEAAEAGQARAESCLRNSSYTATWNDASRLRPDTTCTGTTIGGGNRYVMQSGNVRTTFEVLAPITGLSSSAKVTVIGKTELLRTSTQTVYQTYSQTLVQQSSYAAAPKIAGGGGWKGIGHLATVLTNNKELYGFGANSNGQITDSQSPASVLIPAAMSLPVGVTSAEDIKTSGQGASFICILANTAQVWCRGTVGGFLTATSWQRFALPGALTAVNMSISGYGPDTICVVASDGQGYCAGESYFGSLGEGNTAYSIYPITSPQRFRLDIPAPGASLRKMYTDSHITCGITTTDDMYCAGVNGDGHIGGPSVNGTGNYTYATPIRYPIPGARKIDDVSVTYHTMDGRPVTHVLATDGTIWGSGLYADGALGNGTTVGSTGSSQTPVLFTHANAAYATGSVFWNAQSSKCIDNDSNLATDGNVIHLWTCGGTGNGPQTWVYGKNKQLTNLGTGKCLDVPGNSLVRGVNLQLYTCNGSAAQQFDLVGGTIVHTASGFCADALNNGTINGTRIQTWTCGASNPAQSFTTWPGINGWRGMITGTNHFCGLRSDDWSGMWCAGRNDYGQLLNYAAGIGGGTFHPACASAPLAGDAIFNVNLGPGEKVDYTKLTDGWRSQFLSTMVITQTGKIFGAGRNEFGKLGNGATGDPGNDYRECETKLFPLPAGVTAVDMSARDEYTTYVLGSDGRIYAAGRNNLGQIGDGTTTTRMTPVEVKIPRQFSIF